ARELPDHPGDRGKRRGAGALHRERRSARRRGRRRGAAPGAGRPGLLLRALRRGYWPCADRLAHSCGTEAGPRRSDEGMAILEPLSRGVIVLPSTPPETHPMRSLLFAIGLLVPTLGYAGDWPCFRGPTGMGQSDERDLPVRWGGKDNTNIAWKVPLPHVAARGQPDNNQSSPIVWKDKVIVTTSYWPAGRDKKEYPEHHVTCCATKTGEQRWDTTVAPGPWLLTDLRGGYTAPTPATDGERIYVVFGSGVVAALDLAGKQIWRKEIPEPQRFDVAMGMSPVRYKDTLLLLCDKVQKSSHLLALDVKNGETRWNAKRPNVQFSHTTPVLAKIGEREQLLIGAGGWLQGVDPGNGEVIWQAASEGDVP